MEQPPENSNRLPQAAVSAVASGWKAWSLTEVTLAHLLVIATPLLLLYISIRLGDLDSHLADAIHHVTRLCMNSLEFYGGVFGWILNHVTSSNINMFIVQSVATCSALIWLLYRAWQTLWKPVPELISILGVEVPDAPEVSLAAIKSDKITVHLTRAEQHKPVTKYLIQVNGVNVGDSQPKETAITITGLRPGNFYNVRVIAVGANNFQAGSQVIRLRTFGKNGRPKLGSLPGQSAGDPDVDSGEESPVGTKHVVGIETAALPEGSHVMVREQSGGGGGSGITGQRRNTIGRKHSPSTAGADQSTPPILGPKQPEESMHQLTEKLEAINREKDEITSQMLKDTEDFKAQMAEITRERDEKRQILKEKEEASERLKREGHHAERLNRQAQTKKSNKEKILKDKQMEKTKMQEDMTRWEKEIERMRAERDQWRKEKEDLVKKKDKQAKDLRESIRKRQNSLNTVEEEIRIKGLKILELESERKKLPGAEENEETKSQATQDLQEAHEWSIAELNLSTQLNVKMQQLRDIEQNLSQAQAHLATLEASIPIMYHGNSSGVDFDPAGAQGKAKSRRTRNRKSRTSTISSPIEAYPIRESQFPSAGAYNSINHTATPTFAPGPYMDLSTGLSHSENMQGMTEQERHDLTGEGPMSPGIEERVFRLIDEDDPPSPLAGSSRSFGPALPSNFGNYENIPNSPESSSRSASLMSSPRNSAHNLSIHGIATRDYGENERRSMQSPPTFGAIGSPVTAEQSTTHKNFKDLFTLQRARGKTMQEEGPALGTLKQGQSQSFPRSMEEPEASTRYRRLSFSSSAWPSFLQRSATSGEHSMEGNGPAPARNTGARKRRGFNMFGSSIDDPNAFPDRDPSSPRPLSVASSDLPRPSTDSAPFGWGPAQDNVVSRNSPLNTNWSVQHQPASQIPWGSRNPSRRPSFQHGSSTALTSGGIVSDDDEFLPPSEALGGHSSPPPAIGVIGTRPSSSHKPITPKLNPAAPAFKGFNFGRNSRPEKEKGKGKGRFSDKSITDEMVKPPSVNNTSSPPESRKSRDTPSIRTQNSTAESHDSLASLEQTSSNTPSELATPLGSKDKDSAFRQLLRKGSSSKFSISSFRNKETGLFSSKKVGSASNSDRNASVERDGSFDEFGEEALGRSFDSVTSSPMIGSVGSGDWKGKDKDSTKEGRMSVNWGRFSLKKPGKGRESLDEQRGDSETMVSTEDEA